MHHDLEKGTKVKLHRAQSSIATLSLTAALCCALLVPSSALAGFREPFLGSIESTPSGPLKLEDGLTIDKAGDLWVGDGLSSLSEFDSSGAFIKTVELKQPPLKTPPTEEEELIYGKGEPPTGGEGITPPDSISIDYATGQFFLTGDKTENNFKPFLEVYAGTGAFQERWEKRGGSLVDFGGPAYVAVDNSTQPLDPSACVLSVCTVYVSQNNINEDNESPAIKKFNSSGVPEDYECTTCTSYIRGNAIIGAPNKAPGGVDSLFREPGVGSSVGDITIDSEGDIYAVDNEYEDEVSAVLEYRPSGEFVQAIGGSETPGLGESHDRGGFGGKLEGVAIDPRSGLVAVAVSPDTDAVHVGAVDEFDPSSGRFVSQITEAAPGKILESAGSVAFDPKGNLYVDAKVAGQQTVLRYGPGGFTPDFKPAEVSGRTSVSAVLNGLVNPESNAEVSGLSECQFEYVSEAAFKANDLNALQSLTLAGATGGTYSLGLGGQSMATEGTGELVGPASGTGDVIEGSNTITGLVTTASSFVAGEEISGSGIPAATTIVSVHPGAIVLSTDATASGSEVALSAVSDEIYGVSAASGAFVAGEQIAGAGIPSGTTITAVGSGTITLSADVTASGGAVALTAGLAYDASAAQVQAALEGLSSIGAGDVAVSGGHGGPFTVEFKGTLAHTEVSELSADTSGLTPTGASVTPTVKAVGGDGWGTAARVACENPNASEIEKNDAYQQVHASVSGLESGVSYYYRLNATPAGRLGKLGYGQPLEFTAPGAPQVMSSSVTNVSSTYAELDAQIAVVGAPTSYYFEYGTTTAYGETAPALTAIAPRGAPIGSGGPAGNADSSAVQQVGALTPGTTYYYRVVATSTFINATGEQETATTNGPKGSFETVLAPARGLPDNRAYELVTPPDKGSAEDMFAEIETEYHRFENKHSFGYASESGEEFLLDNTFAAFGPYPAFERNPSSPDGGSNAYLFSRTEDGWQTIPLAQPSLGTQTVEADVFEPENLSKVGISDGVGAELGATGIHSLQLVASLGGPGSGPSFTELASDPQSDHTRMVGASRNLEHVVWESKDHTLAPGDAAQDAETAALYEYYAGTLVLVNVNSEGSLLNRCGAVLGQNSGLKIADGGSHNAVSADGSRVFFTSPDPYGAGAECWNTTTGEDAPQLYMRSSGETVQVSAPEEGVEEAGGAPVQHPAIYVGASEDGSKVFFITETELTQEVAALKLHDSELYEYDTQAPEGQRLVRVSRGEPSSPVGEGVPAEVSRVEAVSSNGAAVYFTAFGQMTPDAPAVKGEEINLYRYDTASGATTFVATVDEERDYPGTSTASWWKTGHESRALEVTEVGLATNANWYTTPDGDYLLFATTNELDFDHSTVAAKARDCPTQDVQAISRNDRCSEVYRYDALQPVSEGREGEGVPDNPRCVSCDPGGTAPVSDAFFGHAAGLQTPAAGPVRAMSDTGEYVFFDSADPLVPLATNKTNDVYEWHDGVVSLIGSGTDPTPSYFLGASSNGANVFFGTHAQLVPQDTDTAGDVYDARICTTAEPCIKAPLGETAQCEGGACQSPPSVPIEATPTSLSFSGPGNVTAPAPTGKSKPKTTTRCKRGWVKKKVRKKKRVRKKQTCVRKPKKGPKAKKRDHGRAKQ